MMSDIADAVSRAMCPRWESLVTSLYALSPRGPTAMCSCKPVHTLGQRVASCDLGHTRSFSQDKFAARALRTLDHDRYGLSAQSGSSRGSSLGASPCYVSSVGGERQRPYEDPVLSRIRGQGTTFDRKTLR
jgi:hypothetical protein